MNIVQGFITIDQYVLNTPGIVADYGELSTHSRTYSKTKGEYRDSNTPGVQLTTFKATNGTTGLEVVLPEALTSHILRVVQNILNYAMTHPRPYVSDDFKNSVASSLVLEIAELQLGPTVPGSNADLPEFAIWKSIKQGYSEIRVWFSDRAFAEQYTGYEIKVIPPFPTLSSFFTPYATAKAALELKTMTKLGQEIQEAKGREPETVVRLVEFDFVNRHDRSQRMKTTWGVLIYGQQGDYVDSIKDAIATYLLDNSTNTQPQWELIFPGIFDRAEIIVVPRWDLVAVENLTTRGALYSSLVGIDDALTFITNFLSFYPADHIKNNSYLTTYPFKTVALSLTDGYNNDTARLKFRELYPDYLPIPSTNADFARMTLPTQNFILFLDDLLIWAEKATALSELPSTLRRVTRNNKFFLASTHGDINFLVATKMNAVFQ